MDGSSPITPEMIDIASKIEQYNKKLNAIGSNSCKELQNEIHKLNNQKEYQLQMLKDRKDNELQIAQLRYKQQISHIEQQEKQQIQSFKKHSIKQLQKMKKSTNKNAKDIDLNTIYKEWVLKKEKNNNQRTTRYTRTRSLADSLQTSLNDDEIRSDLMHLMSKAKEQNIAISPPSMSIKQQKKKSLKYRSGVVVNEDDKLEIEHICDKVGLHLEDKHLRVALYGYKNHLDVYKDILEWITNLKYHNVHNILSQLKSGKLRDIQVKLSSQGTVGRKNEMAFGIREKLKQLSSTYNSYKSE